MISPRGLQRLPIRLPPRIYLDFTPTPLVSKYRMKNTAGLDKIETSTQKHPYWGIVESVMEATADILEQ